MPCNQADSMYDHFQPWPHMMLHQYNLKCNNDFLFLKMSLVHKYTHLEDIFNILYPDNETDEFWNLICVAIIMK
jgi:hypothetical protein